MSSKAHIGASATMVAIFAAFVTYAAAKFGPEARLMPLLVGIPGLALSILQLRSDVKQRATGTQEKPLLDPMQWRIAIWLVSCVVAIILFGFDVATVLMVAVYHRFVQREKLITLLVSAAAAYVTVSIILDRLFGAQLYEGMLTPAFIAWIRSF
ncbi:tripartite tricarboxylate transporter TctB family protein [Aestuariivirga litoralis]|uniref:tripartite tricarboxylate transporter TctB family protein n=1 Tax=Aestuariivirga litoralis TaxID=2650924 RepID=UPI0018C6D7A8|nr:tripartite tricarboxylate transporter TctB family protein [Aestuariivirga litoralis]MBG1231816.1 hypothetical protein [Aestuariivirga litoralis]